MSSACLSVADGGVRDHGPRPLRDARRARSNGDRKRRRPLRDAAAVAGACSASSVSAGCCSSASIISTRREARRRCKRPRLGELVLPLFSLIVLLLPFLPVIPDRWPALQALAGPLGAIVWLVGGGAAGVDAVAIATDHGARDRAMEPAIDHDRDLRRDARGRRPRRAEADRHGAVSVGRRAALPGHRAEPVARRRSEDREQPPARRLSRVLHLPISSRTT